MMNRLAVIVGLVAASALLLYWGGEAPVWLLTLQLAAVMAAALFLGFTTYSLSAPDWTRHDAVKGVLLVYLGIGVMLTDPRFLISAFLIGCGCKMLMRSATETTARVVGGRPLGTMPGGSVELVIKQEGGISRHG